jgi:site-specific recombinase XerD
MTKSNLPAGRREISRAHVTFYRAVMDGIEARRAWDLYLAVEGDFTEPLCAATLGWIRLALINEAVAANEPGLIGLFRRDPRQMKASSRPTLTEFASRFEGAGDWSEAELTAMWKEEYGGVDKSEERRARLGKRLRHALQLLEKAARRRPAAADPVERWLAPNLAEKLAARGLLTLGQARAALAARRTPRWEEVPGVGQVWADRLQAWMDENEVAAPPSSTEKPASAIVPLERFRLALPSSQPAFPVSAAAAPPSPPALDASRVTDDKRAIELWLETRASNPNTLRAYRKNAERLLFWCQLERRITFPEMLVQDCLHYRTWLQTLGRKTPEEWAKAGWHIPAEQWIGPRHAHRSSEAWRPFEGALAPGSVAQDLLTVRSLFEFLRKIEYIQRQNQWDLLGKARPVSRTILANATQQFTGRSLTLDQWKLVTEGLDAQGPELERRLLLVLWLGFACGLRAAEMLSLTLANVLPRESAWALRVVGKGGKARRVPLPSPARDALLGYLDAVGVPFAEVESLAAAAAVAADESPEMLAASAVPILRGRHGRRSETSKAPSTPLQYGGLYESLKLHLKACAERLDRRDPVAATKFRRASTHWLRHTCATLALKSGVKVPGVQKLLGHSSLAVTSKYVTEDDDELQKDMERFAQRATE